MAKIMLDEDILSEFSQFLWDICFSINCETNKTEIDRKVIYDLTERLAYSWDDIYNPAEVTFAKALRSLYGQYIKAKKDGDMVGAGKFLASYLALKERG
ncbi:MAG: hypothetical protein GX992_00555 [Clostridium sp.]|nr:hypothetical protein [Clostridium sp.]